MKPLKYLKNYGKKWDFLLIGVRHIQPYQMIPAKYRKNHSLNCLIKIISTANKNQLYIAQPAAHPLHKQNLMICKTYHHFSTDIIFKDSDGNDLIIATTRPELLPACVAVLYNPDDVRYTHLHGKKAIVPLFGQTVPFIT